MKQDNRIFPLVVSGLCLLAGLGLLGFDKKEEVWEISDCKIKSLRLKNKFLLKDSIYVFFGDSLLSQDAYDVSYEAGEIVFHDSVPTGTRIKVVYYYLPLQRLKLEYARYQLVAAPAETIDKEKKGKKEEKPDASLFISEEELSLNGSKLLGFSYSKEGLTIEQSTDLRVKGKLSGVGVELFIQDRGQPELEEGFTKEFRELEAVSLVLSREPNRLTFGDFENLTPFAEFGNIKRKGQGIKFAREKDYSDKVSVSYQRPKNKLGVQEFFGVDGKKGPYILTAEGRRVSVITGSEEVYLNGERLKRGEGNDYQINYSQGELTFTNRVRINSLSRIEVRFLYKAEDYERDFYSLFLEEKMASLRLAFSGFQEGDVSDYNFSHPISEDEKRFLATIGDDTTKAYLSGERYVGKNKGDYKKENGRFVYVGKDSGDYEVSFSFFGDGLGDYIYDNRINAYSYVGEGRGRYRPKVKISLPQKRQVLSPVIAYSPSTPLSLSLQGILINNDLNTFSTKDDNDNLGLGYNLGGEYKEEKFNLRVKRKGYMKNYHFPEEAERDFVYRWGETKDSVKSINLLEGNFLPFKFFGLNFGAGLLEKTRRVTLFSSRVSFPFLSLGLEKAGRNLRGDFRIAPKIHQVKPELFFFEEQRPEEKNLTYRPAITFSPFGQEITAGWEEQRRYKKEGVYWVKEKLQQRVTGEVKIKNSVVSFIGLLGREGSRDLKSGDEMRQNFADAQISLTEWKGISLFSEYSLLHKGTEEKEVNYIKVEEGKGDYRKDPNTGQYFYHPKGDYIRVFVPTGRIQPAQERNLKGHIGLNPIRPFTISLNLAGQEQKSDTASFLKTEELSSEFTYNLLSDLRLVFNKNYHSYQDRNFYYENNRQEQDQNSFRLEKEFGAYWKLTPHLELNNQRQYRLGLLARRLTEKNLIVENFFGFAFNLDLKVGLGETYGEEVIIGDSFKIIKNEFGIGRRFSIKKNTSLFLGFDLTRRISQDELPYDLGLTEPLGYSYEFRIEGSRYQRENLSISFSYSLKKLPQEALDHILNSRLVINF